MSLLIDAREMSVDCVLHPTDLSEASLVAFHHALAIGIRYRAQFTLLHAIGRRATDSWPGFPSVRETLARWRGAGTTEGLEDSIRNSSVSKVEIAIPDPVAASLDYIDKHPVDMIVLATEGREGLSRLLRPSLAERLARESKLLTLFVPGGARPFVVADSGEVTLKRILLPVTPTTDPRSAMLFAARSAALLDDPALEVTLLYVGEGDEVVQTDVPDLPYCRWNLMRRNGDADDQILAAAAELHADAIYMTTEWHRPRLAGGVGGVTERVLRRAPCPVAAIPVADRP
jgi:nucleotide-binding universal stress UspA family protein